MKSAVWVLMLSSITFGIGWTSSRLTETLAPDSQPVSGGDRGWHTRGEGHGSRFPFAGSADQFADELGLDTDQQERLAELLEDSARRIREHEDSIFTIKSETRRGMLDLLSEGQRERLDELFAERIRRRSKEHIAFAVSWFRDNVPGLDAAAIGVVEATLVDYEAGKARYVSRMFCGDDVASDEDSERVSIDELRAARDERLTGVVGAETLDRFRSARPSRWKGGRGPAPENSE